MSSTMKDVTSLLQQQLKLIDDVMDCFDFHKVHKVMKFLHWTWAFAAEGVPDEYELRGEARKQLNCVLAGVLSGHKDYMTSCGGFTARATRYDPEKPGEEPCIQLSLDFELEHWDVDTTMSDDD